MLLKTLKAASSIFENESKSALFSAVLMRWADSKSYSLDACALVSFPNKVRIPKCVLVLKKTHQN